MELLLLGWSLSLAADLLILLILFERLMEWVMPRAAGASGWRTAVSALTAWPIGWVGRLFPTVFRGADLSPWVALLVLVLVKTLVFRAGAYWALLHP